MRPHVLPLLEAARRYPPQADNTYNVGLTGFFIIPGPCGEELKIISSEGLDRVEQGWEHVSVSTRRRMPNWTEMCFVKNLFWDDEEVVLQFHPAKSQYVNNHPYCLHLWRNRAFVQPTPPPILVGIVAKN